MQPAIVFPLHDPDGSMFPYLETINPQLKSVFAHAFLGISPITEQKQSERVRRLKEEGFFQLSTCKPNSLVGEQFVSTYWHAATASPPLQVLHLCFPDRVAFALQSKHKEQFIADVKVVEAAHTPLLFQRSDAAWRTHPKNYAETERMAIRVGEMLIGKSFDWTWCHLAVQAQQLREILPHVRCRDMTVLAEIVFWLKDRLQTKDVDWLAWEDPYLYARDADELRRERENTVLETRKRLSYVIPVIQFLYESIKA